MTSEKKPVVESVRPPVGNDEPIIWIVSTGTEILQGHYADTNAQWLSRELLAMGFSVERIMALPDRHEILAAEIGEACRRCDLIVMTGGLGPTADDLNRESIARVYGVDLERDERAIEEIRKRFEKRGTSMPESNAVQALIPKGAEILRNRWGTAPGFFMPPPAGAALRACLLALPGPPREMRPMFRELAAPLLLERFVDGRRTLRTLTLRTAALSESLINDKIKDLFGSEPKVNVALLAGKWRVDVRLTLQGESEEENAALEAAWRAKIAGRIGAENIWGENEETLPGAVGRLLKRRDETLTLAESCTGGLIARQITDVPGCSAYFLEGFVAYSNEAKMKRLGVPRELLESRGAVSPEVAEAMASGARAAAGADWALSVTGIAGPEGGTPEKPVGLVYFGLASPDGRVRHHKILGFKERSAVRELSAVIGLDWLRRGIQGFESDRTPESETTKTAPWTQRT